MIRRSSISILIKRDIFGKSPVPNLSQPTVILLLLQHPLTETVPSPKNRYWRLGCSAIRHIPLQETYGVINHNMS
jgi:hypothetical protein